MLRQELLPFFDIENVRKMLLLSKLSNQIIIDHFLGDFSRLKVLIASHWNIPLQELHNFQTLDQIHQSNRLFNVKDSPFTYLRFNQEKKKFDYLAYPGGNWEHKQISFNYKFKNFPGSQFGKPSVNLHYDSDIYAWVMASNIKTARYHVYLLHGRKGKSNCRELNYINVNAIVQQSDDTGKIEEQKYNLIHEVFIKNENFDSMMLEQIIKEKIGEIDLTQYNTSSCNVKIDFENFGVPSHKFAWILDGMILEPIQ
ncbi:UNKNOWN [Stylonychia lemnae]|uniref:Uncharacterized protein n=1 Tax=Stylonychia lemnae TaxID=5949 RepID=A0A078AVW0_STYLE|nr:UNKNOWN [Stylonychia lemnae]|eukprot:CDW86575.1 UNKNOWN [Stylonychia lemnae]